MINTDYYKKKFYLLHNYFKKEERKLIFSDIYVDGKLLTAEEQKTFPSYWDNAKVIFEHAFNNNDIKLLKNLDRAIDEELRELKPFEQRNKVFAMLKNELGEDYQSLYDKIIEKVEKRGKINSGKEFDIILARVEDIFMDKTKESEMVRLNTLLADYENKKI
jgi:hypothetical protein